MKLNGHFAHRKRHEIRIVLPGKAVAVLLCEIFDHTRPKPGGKRFATPALVFAVSPKNFGITSLKEPRHLPQKRSQAEIFGVSSKSGHLVLCIGLHNEVQK